MKKFPKYVPICSNLVHSSSLRNSYIMSSTSHSYSSLPQKPTSESSLPIQKSPSIHLKTALCQIPILPNHLNINFMSESDAIEQLLKFKNEPLNALECYELAEMQPGFDCKVDIFCVLLHILMGFEGQRKVVRELICRKKCYDVESLISCFVDYGKRFDFGVDGKVFNYLLYGFVSARRFNDAIYCFDWMLENDYDLCVKNVNCMLNALARNKLSWKAWKLYDKLCDRGGFVNGGTVCAMMRACLNDGKPWQAEEVFRKAKERGVELDVVAYNCVVGAVSRKPDANAACAFLREMKDKDWVPSEGTFNNVIVACVKERNMVEALRVKEEMISCGRPMNVVAATSLMKGYCVAGDLESALDLFGKIVEDGVSPNEVTFAVLIDGCCTMGNMEKAFELYDQMIGMGIRPEVYHSNAFIKGYLNAQSLEEALAQLNKAIGSGLVDVSSYNILLSWLCRNNKVIEAQKLWDRMVKGGIRPTVVLYNHLILGYCRDRNVVMADRLYAEMSAKGIRPSTFTFSILIDGHFKKGNAEKALSLYDDMVLRKIGRTEHTYNSIISGLCKVGRTSEARDKLEDFIKEENFKPSCMTSNSIIEGLVKEGDLDLALSIYGEMNEKGVSPTVVTYTILIDGFCKSNKMDHAVQIRNEMKSKGLELDLTAYRTLIDGFCKRRDMGSASKLFNELLESGLMPNKFIYNSMISGYRNLNNMEAALCFYKKMMEHQVPCDLKTYTTLIDGLLREGRLKQASDFYAEMLANGIQPDAITYTVLVNGLCSKGQLENARDLFKEMEEKGLSCNSLIYNALIAGYFREGNLPEAFRLYDEMLEKGFTSDNMTFDFLMNANFTSKGTAKHVYG